MSGSLQHTVIRAYKGNYVYYYSFLGKRSFLSIVFYDDVHQHSIHVFYTINVSLQKSCNNNDNTSIILMGEVNLRYLPFYHHLITLKRVLLMIQLGL